MKRKLHLSFGKRGARRDVDAEIRFHIEMRTREFMAEGMDPDEAREAAEAIFGDRDAIASHLRGVRVRRARSRRLSEAATDFGLDIRHTFRALRRSPVYALAITLTLALGIGANTAVFSLINGVLLRPLPYGGGERLVRLRQPAAGADLADDGFSPVELADYRRSSESFESLAEYHSMSFTLLGLDEPVRVRTGVVSADFFDLLGVQAYIGRTFRPGEDATGADPVLVLSYGFWTRALDRDPDVIGRLLEMNDRTHTVIGVLPPLPQYPDENDVYMPVVACPFRAGWTERTQRGLSAVFGRLKPGVELAAARRELDEIAGDLHRAYPEAYPAALDYGITGVPLRELLVQRARPRLFILLGISGLLLLIACANVANLTLARLLRGEREMAIRAALGAGRGRLVRLTLLETTLLAIVGGGVGLLLAFGGLGLLRSFFARLTARATEVGLDLHVLLFTLALSLVVGLVVGSIPALSGQSDLINDLRQADGPATTGHRRVRARKALIISQVSLAFALLAGAGLLIRSFINLQRVDPGFETESVVSASVYLDWTNYLDPEQVLPFVNKLEERIYEEPGVVSVAVAAAVPLARAEPYLHEVEVEGRKAELGTEPWASEQIVSADYFRTMNIDWIRGGGFEDAAGVDDTAAIPAVINQTLAQAAFGGDDPIGQRICLHHCEDRLVVVGVVADIKQYDLSSAALGEIYLPYELAGWRSFHLLVRTSGDPGALEPRIRAVVREIDPDQPVTDVHTLEQYRSESIAEPRLATLLLVLFAGVALLITATGIGGIIAYSVGQRTREIGIRIVLGADPAGVVGMVVRQALALVAIGLVFGIPAALVLGHGLSPLLFEVRVHDPVTFVSVVLVLALVALAACYGPARRATRIDPITTLRAE